MHLLVLLMWNTYIYIVCIDILFYKDMFYAARRAIPVTAFSEALPFIKWSLKSDIAHSRRLREVQRRTYLCKSLKQLTSASWVIDCWRNRLVHDSVDVVEWEVAMKRHLDAPIRAMVLTFLCADMVFFLL